MRVRGKEGSAADLLSGIEREKAPCIGPAQSAHVLSSWILTISESRTKGETAAPWAGPHSGLRDHSLWGVPLRRTPGGAV